MVNNEELLSRSCGYESAAPVRPAVLILRQVDLGGDSFLDEISICTISEASFLRSKTKGYLHSPKYRACPAGNDRLQLLCKARGRRRL